MTMPRVKPHDEVQHIGDRRTGRVRVIHPETNEATVDFEQHGPERLALGYLEVLREGQAARRPGAELGRLP